MKTQNNKIQAKKEKSFFESVNTPAVRKGVLIGGASIAAIVLGNHIIKKVKKNQTEKRFDEDPVQQATLLHSAMNPSGVSWMINIDGTSNDTLFTIASQITDFNKVAKEYKNLYAESLIERLEKELSSLEYTRMLNMLTNADPQKTDTTSKKYILIPKGAKIYKSLYWYPLGSVVEAGTNSYLNNPTDFKTIKHFGITGLTTFIHSKQYNATQTKYIDVWVDMSDVIIANVEVIKAKYKSIAKNKVVFDEEDFD